MRGAIRTDHNLMKVLPAWNRRGRVNWVVLFEKVIAVRAEVEICKGSRERVSRWGQEEVKRVSAFRERLTRRSEHE